MPSALTTTLIQSTLLNALSNILAQIIDQYQKNKPFSLNTLALLQFITYAIIIVPINFSWQRYLETRWPGFPKFKFFTRSNDIADNSPGTGTGVGSSVALEDDILPRKEKPARWQPRRSSGMRNFAMKFLLDQTAGGVLNIVLFVLLINLLKGDSFGRSWELVCEDFKPIFIARMKYRPVVSTLLYTIVPLDRRVVFGSACGVIWGVYLSLYAAV